MRVAIFSDIHGKILLPFKLADLYQKETGRKLDAILQCGDLGIYPMIEKLDKATMKHAQYDRDELGFHDDFITVNPGIQSFLDELGLDMICVRGNHEDHDFLDELEKESASSRFSIDAYKRVWICRSGLVQELKAGNESLTCVGIGRIGDSCIFQSAIIKSLKVYLTKQVLNQTGQFKEKPVCTVSIIDKWVIKCFLNPALTHDHSENISISSSIFFQSSRCMLCGHTNYERHYHTIASHDLVHMH